MAEQGPEDWATMDDSSPVAYGVPPVRVHPPTPAGPTPPRPRPRLQLGVRRPLPLELADIEQYVLSNVHPLTPPKILGHGSYGVVEELLVDGVRCAGKKIHDILVDNHAYAQNRFVQEGKTMAKLRHPHIVQFLGVWQDTRSVASRLPVLVMEYLPFDLHNILLRYEDIPIAVKVSFLFDIAKGLRYLHSNNYAHRDLTACNVLLNSSLVAKITDFGMTRLVNLSPMHVQRLTKAPGNQYYMPPEATASSPEYTTKMDIFSFGVLALFTVTQQYPTEILPATYEMDGNPLARTEVQRRRSYFECARENLCDTMAPEHRLLELMENCLQYERTRPGILEVYREMEWLSQNVEDPYRDHNRLDFLQLLSGRDVCVRREGEEERVRQLEERLEEAERREEDHRRMLDEAEEREGRLQTQLDRAQEAAREVSQLQAEIEFKDRFIEQLEQSRGGDEDTIALQQKEAELSDIQNRFEAARAEAARLMEEKSALERAWSQTLDQRVQEVREEAQHILDRHLAAAQGREEELRETVSQVERAEEQLLAKTREEERLREKLEAVTRRLEEEKEKLRKKEEEGNAQTNGVPPPLPAGQPSQPSGLRVSLPVVWNDHCPPIPFGISRAQAVVYGSKVIIGGGDASGELARRVLIYDSDRQRWGELGYYSHRHFAIAVMKKQLLLVGGFDEICGEYTGNVSMWDQQRKYWRKTYTPMPTPRGGATAVGYRSSLVVIGGFDGSSLSAVEVLDCDSEQWRAVAPMPEGCLSPQPVLTHDGEVMYVLGKGSGLKDRKHAFSTSLSQLIQSFPGAAGIWGHLSEPPLSCSGAVGLRGYLLAIGGKDKQSQKKASVHMYLPGTGEWLRVAELPYPLHSCTCVSLSPERFLVIGGIEKTNGLILASVASFSNS